MSISPAFPSDPPALPEPPRLLAGAPHRFAGRDAIEGYLAGLNQASPIAERRITRWSTEPEAEALSVGAVLHSPVTGGNWAGDVFMGECRFSFGLDLRTRNPAASPATYAIGLPIAGSMSVSLEGREIRAQAGEGVIIDPMEVERTQVSGGSHFVEFHLPKSEVLRLATAWAPSLEGRAPHFAPHLSSTLAPRLLYMAAQAASVLESPGNATGARMLFQRWTEMIALTLLQEQSLDTTPRRVGAPAPAGVRRAVEFMRAHADSAIALADIAEAACLSASSLLRHFNAHVGMSPYAFLRSVRLERARAELQRGEAGAVRDVALRWGFQNASKFSRAYQAQFGEKPSQTRERGPA